LLNPITFAKSRYIGKPSKAVIPVVSAYASYENGRIPCDIMLSSLYLLDLSIATRVFMLFDGESGCMVPKVSIQNIKSRNR